MGNCFFKRELIEIRFPKEYWHKTAVEKYCELMQFSGMILDHNIYSQYHKCIFLNVKRYKNIKVKTNLGDHVIYVYGTLRD